MSALFSYVVDRDLGFAPNPYGGFCTLAHCKFSISGKKKIVELAKIGDWIAGTGGLVRSADRWAWQTHLCDAYRRNTDSEGLLSGFSLPWSY